MPCAGKRIAPVNVAPDGVCFVFEDESLRRSDLSEVFDWIHPHQGAGWTILFARVRLAPGARWIKRRALAEIAFDRNHVVARIRRYRRSDLETENLAEFRNEAAIRGR